VPRGGPDGGDGGRGGDVVLVCDEGRRDLSEFRHGRQLRAGRGGHGQGKQRHGARGEDQVVAVPPGTQIEGLEGVQLDLIEPGQRAIVAAGGIGGHGNKRFATSTRQAPRFAEKGLNGESGWIELRLKLLADAGLVGLPNAGKSSLLARLTRAKPKVADYPFTTLEPVLGTIEGEDGQLVLADIPGLIEGAAGGAGLGHEFLAHVERCRILLHVVDLAPQAGDPAAAYATVRGELASYGGGLEQLPELIVLSKRDLMPAADVELAVSAWRERLGDGALDVVAVSAVTGEGIPEFVQRVLALTPRAIALPPMGVDAKPEHEVEHRVYRPGADEGFDVVREDGAYRIAGKGIELLAARHDLSNTEALAYVEQRLREIGVVAALKDAGFQPGDELRIGETAFEFYPS
jgi:GTPase